MVVTSNAYPGFSDVKIVVLGSSRDLNNAICREMFEYWDRLRVDGNLGNFDLIEIPGVIPFLVLLVRAPDSQSFRIKITGQTIVEATGNDLTGQTLSAGGQEAPLTAKICQAVLEQKGPVYSRDTYSIETPGRTLDFEETLGLPLFDAEGNISQILLVHGPG